MPTGVGHLKHLQSGLGHLFVGLEAAARCISQLGVTGGLKMKLDLRQLLNAVGGLLDDPLHLDSNLLDGGTAPAQARGDSLQASHLFSDEEHQALSQQIHLAREVVGEGAERNAGVTGDAAIGDSGYPFAPDQLKRHAKNPLAGVGWGAGGQVAPAYPPALSFVRTTNFPGRVHVPTPSAAPAVTDDRDGLAFAGLQQQALLLQTGEVSSREIVELALERAEAAQPTLNAFRVIRAEEAMAEAEEADRSLQRGVGAPLLGVPVAIKDDVDLTGHATPFGCTGEDRPAVRDAEAVRRLREAGAIVIGKTHAPEVGQWHFTETPAHGATRNPWHTDHTPGGSSGGAAAAVAAGLVAAAIGSDGAGSIRIPAAWTGLVGLKPQRGRISTWPDPEAFYGLSCYGPLTRSVGDSAFLLDAIHGNLPADLHRPPPPTEPFAEPAGREPRRLKVALSFATPFGVPSKVDDEHRAAIESLAERLLEMGHEVTPADPSYGMVGPALIPRGMAGVDAWLSAHVEDRSLLEPRTRVHARLGKLLSGPPLRLSRSAEPALRRRLGRVFEDFDVVLTPTTAKPPPPIGALEGRGYWATSSTASAICPFAFAWNVTGWPAISIPAGRTSKGLPIGAQLLGRENDEATLLALAGAVERAGDGWERPPYPARAR